MQFVSSIVPACVLNVWLDPSQEQGRLVILTDEGVCPSWPDVVGPPASSRDRPRRIVSPQLHKQSGRQTSLAEALTALAEKLQSWSRASWLRPLSDTGNDDRA